MIYGIGTDIVQVSRIADAIFNRGDRFAQKILGPEEFLEYQNRKANVVARGVQYLASRFAAKEAFAKAIGTGMCFPMSWQSVQVLNNSNGKPDVMAVGSLAQWLVERSLSSKVSISDEIEYSVAFVIVEQVS